MSSCADINTVNVSDADINSAKYTTFYTYVWYTDSRKKKKKKQEISFNLNLQNYITLIFFILLDIA